MIEGRGNGVEEGGNGVEGWREWCGVMGGCCSWMRDGRLWWVLLAGCCCLWVSFMGEDRSSAGGRCRLWVVAAVRG